MSDDEDLDLSLRLYTQPKKTVNEKNGLVPQRQEEQGEVMQLLTSDPPQNTQPSPPQPNDMTSFANGTNHVIVPTQALEQAVPPPNVSVRTPLPYQPSEEVLPPPQLNQVATVALATPRRGRPPGGQARRNSKRPVAGVERNVGDREIVPPYPWATKKPGKIQSFRDLSSNNINVISGQVHCKTCDRTDTVEYNLEEKFSELYGYIKVNKEEMRHRAPGSWSTPKLIPCRTCKSEMKPVMSERKEEINWLFLLLGQMLGCCTLDQLRYFCQLNSKHRTGSKDRVVYITYLSLCKQLDPEGPFNL
ncbi:hypothetical protein ISN44_As02g009900 [Arabidopsis suecica]|uniref:Uncharacterized protein At2g16190 n=2 Tax=Arabidopsis TaxID=3701 RepID=Q9XIH1_ARATH|nr:uncharacterized protein AT2G16190 [Arabidopsis thaliana]KAG7640947.1 hypothetical protein ISN44_As02g009900 [Arabidopsis suecica]AAD26960.1 hypothetical protein [Arabidopsis thaliana]AAU44446.1 hypothetical protein AT2G16190 [Arabidopsis thaliana]AAX55113.1 hypothetical protein At2g16190 [Arabidopsis thaliana]AEC06469.1 hypothetical protein AT2G16190 [Arabidopsis thaliana]|eukprot:NP_179215.1 hypothetical protein AT2G16190 [Arabidopsis thaliana]